MKKIMLTFTALLLAAPLYAQNQDLGGPVSEGGAVETAGIDASGEDAEGGLTFTVTDESDWADLGVAIPAFATDRDVATPANTNGTAALGREVARVITANLRNNGLFKPVGPDALPQPSFAQIRAPSWATWSGRGAEMLVHGFVQARGDGRLMFGCYLYDVALKDELVREGWVVPPADWRRAAHKCSDLIYSRLTGESPFFDTAVPAGARDGSPSTP